MGSTIIDLTFTDKNTIEKPYIFKDIHLDINNDVSNRDINANLDASAVSNGIANLFLFDKGERILLPEFGNDLKKILYEPINELTRSKINDTINEMIEIWETRVNILNINIIENNEFNEIEIEITYEIPSLDEKIYTSNFVYSV